GRRIPPEALPATAVVPAHGFAGAVGEGHLERFGHGRAVTLHGHETAPRPGSAAGRIGMFTVPRPALALDGLPDLFAGAGDAFAVVDVTARARPEPDTANADDAVIHASRAVDLLGEHAVDQFGLARDVRQHRAQVRG